MNIHFDRGKWHDNVRIINDLADRCGCFLVDFSTSIMARLQISAAEPVHTFEELNVLA